jgi:hypothetical protein
MKFAIYIEIQKGKRKFLVEWDQEKIEDALIVELDDRGFNVRKAFRNVVNQFKRESLRIP